ncbi:purine-nucleoside phosphorylase [Ornithinimicrobium ciconiae]|uniref:Uridine phosphorylase n=1 Tax=Ornithinimicrobium ciconiae TaxID=2594265 RepID=A0A516G6W6_9MICO|nr:purine-nucleoside phosphorylase [Ornithinimicrobium ciconiae]QDO87271.1 purine-nucleoside phosphorylase [Ornithinimicrobium ciconiae]
MSTHIAAAPGQVAPRILLPGDPLRAKWIAENFLEDADCYNEVRGMLGFTGTYRGERVSVQGTGMGQPSLSIYVNELITEYAVQQLVRVGSCGALTERLALRDVVIAQAAATDSSMNSHRFQGFHYPATADFALLRHAAEAAEAPAKGAGSGVQTQGGASSRHLVGTIFSSDSFYHDRPDLTQRLTEFGVLAVEMEAAELYTLAAKHDRAALAICTVSDHIVTGAETTAQEREQTFGAMVTMALDAMLATPLPE